MINRQNLWFLTLFSFILVLGVYYITLPSDIFTGEEETTAVNKNIDVTIEENDKLIALRVERDEEIETVMSSLQEKLVSPSSSAEEKNTAFEELQILNLAKGKEVLLEDKILEEYKIKSFIEIDGDEIKVTIASTEHSSTLANNIMRLIQEEFAEKKYITVKFED